MGTPDGGEGLKILTVASGAIALIIAISGGLFALDKTYTRDTSFLAFTQQYYSDRLEDQYQRVIERIWSTEDLLKREPENRFLQNRMRELNFQKQRLEKLLEDRRK